jgi:hypothetical protein
MSIVDEEYPEIVQGLKRVTCMDCGCVDFIDPNDPEDWEFIGYDDDAEMHRCPACNTR